MKPNWSLFNAFSYYISMFCLCLEIKIYFDRPQFSMTKNSPAQPRLLLSKPAPFDFYVHVHEVDITTESES